MTALDFDPDTGRLRLRSEDFASLVAAATGMASSTPEQAPLFVDGHPHAAIAPALQAIGTPTCALVLRTADPAGVALHRGWIDPEVAALFLDVAETVGELVTVATDHVPAALARILGLGPRRGEDQPSTVDVTVLDRAFSSDPQDRAAAATEILGDQPERWRLSVIEAAWTNTAGEPAGRALALADSPNGLFHLTPEGSRLQIGLVTPSETWRLLIGLLPSGDELGASSV